MSPFKHFLILLFYLGSSPYFQPQSSVAVQVVLDPVCQKQCDKNRKRWQKDKPYKFFCHSAYVDEKKIEKCKNDCIFCPVEVCDEYDDANQFNCPPIVFDDQNHKPCKDRCERNRPRGQRESFTLNCINDVSADKDECYKCDFCPFACSDNYYTEYICPGVKFEDGICKDRCQKSREVGQVGPYELECSRQSDPITCQSEGSQCPDYVYPGDDNTYYCPNPEINTECLEICEQFRDVFGRGDKEYIFPCSRWYGSTGSRQCSDYCDKCDHFVCDKALREVTLYCPQKEEENWDDYNPPKKHSYKGRCKNRCDKSRGGGPQKYDLECKKRYESQAEIDLCTNDCLNECPSHCSDYGGDQTLKCKANQTEIDILEKERQDEIDSLKEEHDQKRHKLVTALIVFGVILAILIGAFVAYILYIRRKHRAGPVPYTHASATTVHGQQQQLQFIPASPQILQKEYENRENANVNVNAPRQPQHQPQYPMQSPPPNSTSTPTFQQYHGNTAPLTATSSPALPPAPPPPSHPPTEPSLPPKKAKAPPLKELVINQPKQPSSPPEPPKATVVDTPQTTPTTIPTPKNKPK